MRFVLPLLLLLTACGAARAQIDSAPKVHVRLVAENTEISPGERVAVAFEQVIRPGWHTYWVNPGEAGLPTEIDWSLPQGWRAGPIEWPYPKRLPVGPLMNYGYEGKVWLLTSLTAPAGAKPGELVNLKAKASWLVCKEVCIPEDATLTLPLTVSASPAKPYATITDQFAAARAKIPLASARPALFHSGDLVRLFLVARDLSHVQLKDAVFFPSVSDEITDFAPQTFIQTNDGLILQLQPAKKPKLDHALAGVVVLTLNDGSVRALTVDAKRGPVPPASKSTADLSLAVAMLFALLGGIILNLMPCVLPILAMKALAIAGHAHGDRTASTRESLAYGAGAIASFLAFGLAIIVLRAGGEAIGWGFQLQNPVVVGGFALLIFIVGLNLSGVFEIPGLGVGESLTRKGGTLGGLFTGVLAVAVAAPCTAPFMAAALGYALTQSPAAALLVFLALGAGFALPFVLIGTSPALARWLPKPGPWMLRLRQFLAFPMYATALWLLWVLSFQIDAVHVLLVVLLALAAAFALWVFGLTQGHSTGWRVVGWVTLVLGLSAVAQILPQLRTGGGTTAQTSSFARGIPAQPYGAALLNKLLSQHQPVFINATAAWCITCLVNEKVAFSGAEVQQAFVRKHINYLVADWTNRNPEITKLLSAYGRSGVPLYLYYPSGAHDPKVLPQILTEAEVLAAIGN